MNRIFFLDTFFIFGLTGSGLFGNAVKIIFLARWAAGRPAGSQRFLPFMATMITLKTARRTDNLVTATFDIDGFAVNQGIGHRAPGPERGRHRAVEAEDIGQHNQPHRYHRR